MNRLPFLDNLANGECFGKPIAVYKFEELMNGNKQAREHHSAIVMPLLTAGSTYCGHHTKKEFLTNPLAIARNGGLENLEEYFDMLKDSDNELAFSHRLGEIDIYRPQGSFTYYSKKSSEGMMSDKLHDRGNFIAVKKRLK